MSKRKNERIKIRLNDGKVFKIPIKIIESIELPNIYLSGKYKRLIIGKKRSDNLKI